MKRKEFIKLTGATGTFIALGGSSLLISGCSKESDLTGTGMEELDQALEFRQEEIIIPSVNRFAVSHDGTECWFPAADGVTLQEVALSTGAVTGTVTTGAPTTGLDISPDGTSLATTQGGTVTPVIIEPLSTEAPIASAVDLQLPTFSPSNGSQICLIGTDDHSVTPGDWGSKTLGTPMPLPHQPKGIDHAPFPDVVGITLPKNDGILLNGTPLTVGVRPEWICTSKALGHGGPRPFPEPEPDPIPHPEEPIPSSFLVTSKRDDCVYIIDPLSQTVTGSVDLNQPKNLACGSDYAIVLYENNKIALIDVNPISPDYATIVKRFVLPAAHEAIAVARDTNRAVILLEGRGTLYQIDPPSLTLDGGTIDLDPSDLTPVTN